QWERRSNDRELRSDVFADGNLWRRLPGGLRAFCLTLPARISQKVRPPPGPVGNFRHYKQYSRKLIELRHRDCVDHVGSVWRTLCISIRTCLYADSCYSDD